MQVARGQGGATWGPRVGGPREEAAEGRWVAGAESEIFRSRTCWSQCCHCSLRGAGQRDHRAPGGPPSPRHGGGREAPHTVHVYIPRPPSLMQAWKEVGASASPGDVAGIQGVQRWCRGAPGWVGVGVGGLG